MWHTLPVSPTRNDRIPTGSVTLVLAGLETVGWDRRRCCARLGLEPEGLEPGRLMPLWCGPALLELGLEVGGTGFGLRAGPLIPYGAMGLLDHLFGAAPTPRAALGDLCRYFRLVAHATTLRLDGDAVTLELSAGLSQPHQRLVAELFFTLLTSRLSARSAGAPLCASLPGPGPSAGGAPWAHTRNRAPVPTLEFGPRVLDRPLGSADDALRGLLDGYAARELAQVPAAESVQERVRRVLLAALPRPALGAGEVARALGMSDRSLRRSLQAEGTRYGEVRDGCLRRIAEQALADPNRDIGEIAWLLGFSEASAFHRAFRRWTGATPRQFRQSGHLERSGHLGQSGQTGQ